VIDTGMRPIALDAPTFDRAYQAFAPRLRAVAFAVLHSREAAEDAVHGALARVWAADAYRSERGPLLPFLIACVRREALDALRTVHRRSARERHAVSENPLTIDPIASIDPFETLRLQCALEALPGTQRDVVVRAYYGHQTLAEVARTTHLPLGTVKSRLAAALRGLHEGLADGSRGDPCPAAAAMRGG
jgi:RNA polymerase sigma-70 factor (ECF subfamily)